MRHPIFARLYDRASPLMERELGPYRDELLDGLSGRVVEIGAGNGINLAHYPAAVDEVVAVEPEAHLRNRAERRAAASERQVSVRDGVAGALPLEDAACDAAVVSLVLCSVTDPHRALTEMWRVVRPGGELRFLEHVRSGAGGRARLQDVADRSRIWPLLGGGCHCARDTVAAIEAGGFRLIWMRRCTIGPSWFLTNPTVIGAARRP